MSSTKAVMQRRTLLKRLGTAAFLATPVFRSVLSYAQTTSSFPLRLVLLNLPGGIPFRGGDDTQLDTFFYGMFTPFKPFESDAIVFDNVQNKAGDKVAAYFELEGHGGGCCSIFGGAVADQGCGGTTACGAEANAYRYGTATTIDQRLAEAIGGKTKFSALHFGSLWDRGQGEDHAECFYKNGQAVRPMSDPMTAFSRLFSGGLPAGSGAMPPMMPSGPDPVLFKAYQRKKSRLDLLKAEIAEVKALAGSEEQHKLDEHLTALRELEAKLPKPHAMPGGTGPSGSGPGAACALPETGPGDDLPATSKAFDDIAYQALNCDLTRIVALQWLSSGDHIPRFQFMGLSEDHHSMEHGSNGSQYVKAQTWIFEQMAAFLAKLKGTPEGSGNMLDHSIVYLASEMGNGTHVWSPALSTIFGKANGAFKTGRRIDMKGRNINDVLLTVVKTMGLDIASVGDQAFNSGAVSLS